MSHASRPFILAVSAAALLSLAIGASSASAFHIPGATYTGTHSGGGSVSFTVSADGLSVTKFRVENYESEFCLVDFVQHADTAPIVNNSFSGGSKILETSYSGTFPSVQTAQGTFTDEECVTGTITWTAHTSASPAGSAECIAAQTPVTEAEAVLAAAQTNVAQANGALQQKKGQVKNAKMALKRASNSKGKAKAKARAKRKAQMRLRVTLGKRSKASRKLTLAKSAYSQAEAVLSGAQAAKNSVCEPTP